MKVVYKYGTGHAIPDGARYLCTQVETEEILYGTKTLKNNVLVWHYYEVDQPETPAREGEKK